MFESLKADDQRNAMQYATSLLISLVVHTAVLGAIVILPMVFFNSLHADELVIFAYDPPSVPVPPPAPAPPTTHRPSAGPRTFTGIAQIPTAIPTGIPPVDDSEEPLGIRNLIQGINTSTEGPQTRTAIGDLLAMNKPIVTEPPQPPKGRTVIRVSGVIQEAKLVRKVPPVYPELAIRAHVSGSVELEAVIDEEGNVADLKILSGHPLLKDAASDAVKQWKYRPTMIGGEPVRVLALVTVVFRFR